MSDISCDALSEQQREAIISRAEELYEDTSDCNIDIGVEPEISVAPDGYWVQAWVYVAKHELEP